MPNRRVVFGREIRPRHMAIVGSLFVICLLGFSFYMVKVFMPDSIVAQYIMRFYNSEDAVTTALKSGSMSTTNLASPEPGENPVQALPDHPEQTPVLPEETAPSSATDRLQPPPQPGPPGTPFKPCYDASGNPPTAPGLAMRQRTFSPENGKIAYLTFDDGPYPTTTPQILDILAREKVRATFFVIGSQVEAYPELLKREHEQGHGIGNHTYSHRMDKIYKGPQTFLDDVKKADDVIFNTVGIHPQVLRAPGGTLGHFNISYYNAVDAAGYLMQDWNVDPGDTSARLVPKQTIVENVRQQIQGKDRAIILLHDLVGKTTTIEALPEIIQLLRQEGFSFGVLGPDVMPCLFAASFKN